MSTTEKKIDTSDSQNLPLRVFLDEAESSFPHTKDSRLRHMMNLTVPNKIQFNFDKDSTREPRRALLYSRNIYDRSDVYPALSGVIVNRETYEAICVPPPQFHLNKPSKIKLDDFHVFNVQIGTTVNLYYYKKDWHYSTHRRHFAKNDDTLYGGLTYQQALSECLPKDFNWDDLDKNKSYTLGFSHPKVHPGEQKGVWVICSFDVNAFNKKEPGVAYNYFDNASTVKPGPEVKEPDFSQRESSLDDYFENGKRHYGYILRPRNAFAGQNATMFQSRLMIRLKGDLYSSEFNDIIKNEKYDRLKFMCLASILSPHGSDFLRSYCPGKVNDIMKDFDARIKTTIDHIGDLYDGKDVERETQEQKLAHNLFKGIKPFMTTSNREVIYQSVVLKDYISSFAKFLLAN